MTDELLVEIIRKCLSIDAKACAVYTRLAEQAESEELSDFWKHMANEETEHVTYWKNLLDFSATTTLPQLFEEPIKIKAELTHIEHEVADIINSETVFSVNEAFCLAYHLEFYMVYPAFKVLFHLMKLFNEKNTPEDRYSDHIEYLINGFAKYGTRTPELEIIADAIQRLWHENKTLLVQSNVDTLTGVFNRRGFVKAVTPLASLGKRNNFSVGILIVDIDNFKNINDSYGHRIGDNVLKKVAETMRLRLRRSDILGRYGGEEFIIYLPSVNTDYLFQVGEELRKRVEEETKTDIPVTVSIGITGGTLGEDDDIEKKIDEFIGIADSCLYKAKAAGRNTVFISQDS